MKTNQRLSVDTLKALALSLPRRIEQHREVDETGEASNVLGDLGWTIRELRNSGWVPHEDPFWVDLEWTAVQHGVELEKL